MLLSSCTHCRLRRVHCLTTENVFHMNSEKTATSQSCYSVSLSSVFLICTDYIQPCILLLFFFNYKALTMASGHFYLTVKFNISATIMSETGVRCI